MTSASAAGSPDSLDPVVGDAAMPKCAVRKSAGCLSGRAPFPLWRYTLPKRKKGPEREEPGVRERYLATASWSVYGSSSTPPVVSIRVTRVPSSSNGSDMGTSNGTRISSAACQRNTLRSAVSTSRRTGVGLTRSSYLSRGEKCNTTQVGMQEGWCCRCG
jgi:hypothetical protein